MKDIELVNHPKNGVFQMMRLLHFCTATALAIIVIGIKTPLALADSFSAVGSVEVPGCSQSATLSEPGYLDISCGTGLPSGTIFGTLGWSSGDIHYFMNPMAPSMALRVAVSVGK